MRRDFKPTPADEIDDEDEQCRVRHDALVARLSQPYKRPSDFWFVACVAIFAVAIIGAFYLVFSHYP